MPIGLKNTTYSYFLSATEGYVGNSFHKFTYTGSKASNSFTLTMSDSGYSTEKEIYNETKSGFIFVPVYGCAPVKVGYSLQVGKKKTYTATVTQYDENYNTKKVTKSFTTTVKAANSSFTRKNGSTLNNVIAIEITGTNNVTASYIFRLNKGLIYASYEETNGKELVYGESLELTGQQ